MTTVLDEPTTIVPEFNEDAERERRDDRDICHVMPGPANGALTLCGAITYRAILPHQASEIHVGGVCQECRHPTCPTCDILAAAL